MSVFPLLHLPATRVERELQHALDVAHTSGSRNRRLVRLAAFSFAQALIGGCLVGLGFHLGDGDRGQAALLAGLLVANCGPMWTWILASWSGASDGGAAV